MTFVKSVVASIALVVTMVLSVPAGAQPAESGAGSDQATHSAANASAVGKCNALAGRALGLVHRIDQGIGNHDALCANLGGLFASFGDAGCLQRLNDGELFLTHAVGQYQLACEVFTSSPPDGCGFVLPPPPAPQVCQF